MTDFTDNEPLEFRLWKDRTRLASFSRTFRYGRTSEFELCLGRLLVLFEDIRLEVTAAAMIPDSAPLLDAACGPEYRMLYFMRRGMGTLVEYAETINRLRGTSEFLLLEGDKNKTNDRVYIEEWRPAVEFFCNQRTMLEKIRNDVGGHFGEMATRRAFEAIPDNYFSRAAIQIDLDNKFRVLPPFTKEIATAALLHHLSGNTKPEQAEALMELLKNAVDHALNVTHFLIASILWERMG